MGKKSNRNTTKQAPQQESGSGGVPAALARRPVRPVPRETPWQPAPPAQSGKAQTPSVAKLRVDEEQYPRGCAPAAVRDSEPQGLAVTYSFDAPDAEKPYSVAIRFVGSRVSRGNSDAEDRFDRTELIEGLAAGMGRVAVTAKVHGIRTGEWKVLASPVEQPRTAQGSGRLPRRVVVTRTRFSQLAQGPSVRLAAWPVLVGLGAAVAIMFQIFLAARAGMNAGAVLALSLVGCVLGFAGGKAWYLGLHRKHPRTFVTAGACIQGFLIAALGTLAVGAALFRLPAAVLLDVTTPGVFFGMTVGRPGCFLTGCCAGRPTASRWGLTSSDRRIVIRRFPVQLVEAATALAIGIATLVLVLAGRLPAPGAIFVAALATYTLARQLLFPLRTESRTKKGRWGTIVASTVVLIAVLAVSVIA